LFSGSCKSGHTIDIKKELNPKTIANAESLPFEDNYFEGGFADPPYNKQFAETLYNCNYPKWSKWTNELVRVIRPNGRIGIMQNYIVPRLKDCKVLKVIIILTRIKQYPKIVTLQQKDGKKQKTLEDYGK
jgi:ubiquinone/menaquinone biosynthesis C-methylase UbiE